MSDHTFVTWCYFIRNRLLVSAWHTPHTHVMARASACVRSISPSSRAVGDMLHFLCFASVHIGFVTHN